MTYPVERLRNALEGAGLIEGYTVRYDRWSDTDLHSESAFVVFRGAGTGGDNAFDVQMPDVRVILVGRKEQALMLRDTAWGILKHFRERENITAPGVWIFDPISFPQGPFEMADGQRFVWELTIRVGVTDH